ncbi:RagB/SusD family nutrient uptake outer membrane protein [Sphingobacterium lumbrici]|uniref:RagB/SusD family nutrient uptake outer membrane protein n=1 Tax=Sphingobacterium lumbrici TaxID=2559600 RepID=UPI00112DF79C|nr:RagB/SusD family nutrient uptake outer membrane protein [Sphingobacterium lumbrici]
MKKLFLFYILIGGLFMNSCTDFLDLPPKNQRAVNSLNDVKSALAGYLDAFARSNTRPIVGPSPIVTEAQNMMFEAYADNFDFEANMGQYINSMNIHAQEKFYANKLLFNDVETTDYIWNNYYAAIGFFNALIDQCDQLKGADEEELKRVKGEMLVHRAYFIFKLQQYFAPMDQEDLGIPLFLHTGTEEVGMEMKRKQSSEIYSVLTADLKQALAFFNEVGPNQGFNHFFNNRYIQNLLAQVYWFKAESSAKQSSDYVEAQKYALAAIEGTDNYIPKTHLEFQNVQRNLNTEYPAVYMQSISFGTVAPIFGSNLDYIGYSPNNLEVSADFFNLFDANDLRKAAYFNGTVMSSSWPDGMANGQKYVRIHLFTPEEAYLILAESYYRNNEPGLALTTLNKFKGFRGAVEKSGLTGTALLEEIINERRKEFFCDTDKRWLDLKRYRIGNIERNLQFFNTGYTIKVEPGDYHYALPIPLAELQENPNMVPNQGWTTIVF